MLSRAPARSVSWAIAWAAPSPSSRPAISTVCPARSVTTAVPSRGTPTKNRRGRSSCIFARRIIRARCARLRSSSRSVPMWKFMSTRPATVSPAMSAAATTKPPTRRRSDARSAGSPSTSGDRTSRRHGADRGPHRTADAGAAEAAIAGRILGEILLMIILGKIEVRGGQNLCRDGTVPARGDRLLVHRLRSLCGRALRGRVHVDTGPVLGAEVVAWPQPLSRVMTLPEGFHKRLVGIFLRVDPPQDDLIVASVAGTNFLIGGIWRDPARVADRRDVNPVPQFPEFPLSAP